MKRSCILASFFLCFYWLSLSSFSQPSTAQPQNNSEKNKSTTSLTTSEKLWIKENPKINVGGSNDWTPFNFADKYGKHKGIANDYLSLITKYTGLTFDISIADWNDSLAKIKTGEIDILPAVYYTKEREQYLNFSQPYFEALDYFFIHNSLKATTLADLDGKKVALPKDYAHIEILKKNFPNINIYLVDTFGEAIDAVLERRADILYDTYGALIYTLEKEGINTIVPFKSTRSIGLNPIHLVTLKKNKVLTNIINKGLSAITDNDRKKIYNRWLRKDPHKKLVKQSLTQAERDWLKNNPIIKYGAEEDWAPYDFVNLQGQHDGLSHDYLNLIGNELGIKFVPVVDKWSGLIEKIKQKDIDLLPVLYYSKERDTYLKYSEPYQTMMGYVFIREDVIIKTKDDWANKTLAIPKDYSSLELIKLTYPDINIIEVDDIASAITAVLENKADFLIDSYPVINFFLKNNGITTIKPYKFFNSKKAHHLHMGALEENTILVSIINKVLKQIPQRSKDDIKTRWLGDKQNNIAKKLLLSTDEKKWLEQHPIITFTGDPNWLPYEAKDEQGQYIGIVSDYLKVLENALNITFKYIPTDSWQESSLLAKLSEVDVLSATNNSSFTNELQFTKAYLSSPIVIVMKSTEQFVENINNISSQKIAIVKDYGNTLQIKKDYPHITFKEVKTIAEGLTAVSTGKIDAFLGTLAPVSHLMSNIGINNIRIVGTTEFKTELAFGVTPSMAPLIPVLNKALRTISPSKKQSIIDTWGEHQFITKVDYKLITQIVAVFVFILLFIIYWNKKLRNEVLLRKEAQTQTNVLLENIPQQIIVTTPKGNIITANNKAKIDNNLTDKDIDNLNIAEFYENINDRDKVAEHIKQHGKVDQLIIPFKRYDGSVHSMMLSVIPITYKRKPVFLTIAVDVTERLAMESALEEAKRSAEMANKAKSEFLANMSHEIRTPMNAIIGFTDLLSEQITDRKLKTFVSTIKSAGSSLLMLINDILDLSKIEAGKLTIIKESTNLNGLFDEIGNVFLMKVKSKNLDFIIDSANDIPNSLLIDKARVRQILFNLVGNAVKFTDSGFITLKATIETQKNNQFDLIISVQDSGIGISTSDQQSIFESFNQREGQSVRKYGGTGLGLTISKRLTELMNGELSVNSVTGEGSCFSLKLKAIEQATADDNTLNNSEITDIKRIDFLGATILIADDVEDNRQLLKEIFSSLSIQLLIAKNGKEAIEKTNENNVDLILMDIRMPEMDGYEAAKIIKESQSTVPIIALTASVMRDDYERQRRESFDGYLRKPVLQKELIDELTKHLSHEYITENANDNTKEFNHISNVTLSNKELLNHLSDNYLPICKQLQKSNQLNGIIKFSTDLESWAKENRETSLSIFAQELFAATDVFDINKIKSYLNQFVLFIHKNKP